MSTTAKPLNVLPGASASYAVGVIVAVAVGVSGVAVGVSVSVGVGVSGVAIGVFVAVGGRRVRGREVGAGGGGGSDVGAVVEVEVTAGMVGGRVWVGPGKSDRRVGWTVVGISVGSGVAWEVI
jgi:hypothetical protein